MGGDRTTAGAGGCGRYTDLLLQVHFNTRYINLCISISHLSNSSSLCLFLLRLRLLLILILLALVLGLSFLLFLFLFLHLFFFQFLCYYSSSPFCYYLPTFSHLHLVFFPHIITLFNSFLIISLSLHIYLPPFPISLDPLPYAHHLYISVYCMYKDKKKTKKNR